ncbi:hypothetical protein CG91_gp083 [Mycobacterium phage 39HC]|uniref:hypothetical protein n=1 Tax=Mycobacterium phage 39HC TaxID=1463809 RepID=UPI0003F1F312|nr:hypothetical protein CG91_gp083 [Mycobacterium phage 39HC]AHJ88383.1 hypothetical protein 39HC_083 [Mycobacterium phage 39HC]AHJ88483.1 hypothetical protein 40BC_083 [Mycobacterium phage 40BC]
MTLPGRVCRCGHAWVDHVVFGDGLPMCDRCDDIGGCDNDTALSVPDVRDGLVADLGGDWYRPSGQGDGLKLKDVTLAEGEVICAKCWLVHRPGTECP